ncbi:hypothetical protein HHI36_000385 [Cryptolaemus montrouzieri]|uniref:Uncharacterized protein n=1 Tax=Cryptolaemus montrouzieri TaxID=559131 RepID=A0ABD2P4Y8_9CUCU
MHRRKKFDLNNPDDIEEIHRMIFDEETNKDTSLEIVDHDDVEDSNYSDTEDNVTIANRVNIESEDYSESDSKQDDLDKFKGKMERCEKRRPEGYAILPP